MMVHEDAGKTLGLIFVVLAIVMSGYEIILHIKLNVEIQDMVKTKSCRVRDMCTQTIRHVNHPCFTQFNGII